MTEGNRKGNWSSRVTKKPAAKAVSGLLHKSHEKFAFAFYLLVSVVLAEGDKMVD